MAEGQHLQNMTALAMWDNISLVNAPVNGVSLSKSVTDTLLFLVT
jgi:hypothetical protein